MCCVQCAVCNWYGSIWYDGPFHASHGICITWHMHHMAYGICITWHMHYMACASHGMCITWHTHHMAYASHGTWHLWCHNIMHHMAHASCGIYITWHMVHASHGICSTWRMHHMAHASHGICITWHMHHMHDMAYAWHGICMTWHMYDSCMRQTGCCYLGAVFTPCLLQRSLLTPHMSGSYTLYWLYYTHCHSVVIIVIIHAQTACWLCTHATEHTDAYFPV